MNSQELLKLANDSRPDLISDTAEAMIEIEEIDPDTFAEVKEDFELIFDVTHEKLGGVGDTARTFGTLMVGSALAGLGGAMATDLYDAARRGLTKGRNWNRIMEANPNLRKQVDDPKRLRTVYSTLHRYAPDFTADPMMGGAILKAMANLPEGSEANFVSNLISSRKNLIDARNNQFKFAPPKLSDDKPRGGGPGPSSQPLGASGKPVPGPGP